MTVERDLERLAAAVLDAAAVRPGDVVLLLGHEDAGPLAVALTSVLGGRAAVVRPWLQRRSSASTSPRAATLVAGLAARADVVLGLGMTPPGGPARTLRVEVPTHATAQAAGRSLPTHARALADAPIIDVPAAAGEADGDG